jgi:hypothetical protein
MGAPISFGQTRKRFRRKALLWASLLGNAVQASLQSRVQD